MRQVADIRRTLSYERRLNAVVQSSRVLRGPHEGRKRGEGLDQTPTVARGSISLWIYGSGIRSRGNRRGQTKATVCNRKDDCVTFDADGRLLSGVRRSKTR